MISKPIFLFIFICLCSIHKTEGQVFELKGTIKDSLTKEILPYTTIHNLTLNKSVLTNALGQFTLPCIFGINVLRINHVGCEPKKLNVNMSGSIDTLILLAHHQHALTPVVITGEKGKLISLDKDKLSYDEILQSGSKSIGSILDKISGVSSLKTGFTIAKPVIQGMYGSRVTVINNGLKQEGQQWGSEHGLEIDPYNTSIIQLIKGAEALRYTGDAIGGLLLTEPVKFMSTDTVVSNLILTGTDNGKMGTVSGSFAKTISRKKFGQLGLRLQGTLKRGGNLRTPDYYLMNTGIFEQNASATIQLIKTKRNQLDLFTSWYSSDYGILSTSHIGNLTDLNKILSNDYNPLPGSFTYKIERPYQSTNHSLSRAKWVYHIASGLYSELMYGYQLNRRKEFDSHNYFNKSAPSLDFKLQTHQLDYLLSKSFKDNLNIKVGISAILQSNQYTGRYFIPNYLKQEIYQFSIIRYKLKKNEFEFGYRLGGLKMDIYKWENDVIKHYGMNYNGYSWNLGWMYKLDHDWQIAINAGKVWRSPNISELFSEGLHHGAAAIEYGNLTLKPEHALSANLALKYKHNKTTFEGEAFIKKVKNYIYLNPKIPAELTIRGAFPAFNYIQTDADFYGMDIWLEHQFSKHLAFTEKSGLLIAKNSRSEIFINGIPPFRLDHGLQFKTDAWKKLSKVKLSISVSQVLQQKRYTEGTDYQAPPAGYFLLNAGFSSTLTKKQNLDLFFTIDNILNTMYRSYLNRFRYFSDEVGRMVTIGIHNKF